MTMHLENKMTNSGQGRKNYIRNKQQSGNELAIYIVRGEFFSFLHPS